MNIRIALLSLSVLVGGTAVSLAQNPAAKAVCPVAKSAKCDVRCAPGDSCKALPCPFEGLNLSADQQAKLKAITPAAKRPGADRREAKAAKTESRKQARADYLAKIKAILTPEQYVQFLENSYTNAGFCKDNGKFGRKGKFDRKDKRSGKGSRDRR